MRLKKSFVISPKEPTQEFGLISGNMECVNTRHSVRSVLSPVCISRLVYFLVKDRERQAVCSKLKSLTNLPDLVPGEPR